MARAGKVPGIRPRGSLRENAIRVINVRLGELLSWRDALDDPALVRELHDMRIAAKRLRYALEMFEICFPDAKPLVKDLSHMQDDLGAIHDLDVLTDILRSRLDRVEHEVQEQAASVMASEDTMIEKGRTLRRLLSAQSRDSRRLGLLALVGDLTAQRQRQYDAFVTRWGNHRLDELASGVVASVTPGPPADSAPIIEAEQVPAGP